MSAPQAALPKAWIAGPTMGRRVLPIVLAVVLLHAWIVDEVAHRMQAFESTLASPPIQRMEVAFVRALEQQPPAAAPAAPKPVLKRLPPPVAREQTAQAAKRPDRAASAAQDASPVARLESTLPSSEAFAPLARNIEAEPDADRPTGAPDDLQPNATSATATTGEAFAWPPSTRLEFSLTGDYRGPIEGNARVQWVRRQARYQVQMDVFVGPEFAPVMWRRMTSDGMLADHGLAPRRYDEETRLAFRSRRVALQFEGDRVTLAHGVEQPMPAGVQDSASQFVQLSYLFTTQPGLLAAGQSVTLPVALPRRLDTWIYDVVKEETLETPIGSIRAFHVKPRRESPRPGELVAQAWFAPSLQYLPVRILIHQDAQTYVDLLLKDKPTQAEPGR